MRKPYSVAAALVLCVSSSSALAAPSGHHGKHKKPAAGHHAPKPAHHLHPVHKAKVVAPTISWQQNVGVAFHIARLRHKLVMVDFYTTWCEYCKLLDHTTYTDPVVRSLARRFVTLKANPEKDVAADRLAKEVGVTGFPYILFVSPEGNVVSYISGYEPAPEFARYMRAALTYKGP
ncbi:MAG: thioredoxin fold domain-containing protein [Armatimonadetes bacterium]|nr:thioredoxin fold domain-containing protein [Armatimonadota bacterium]MDE2205100.1 thioredoxin fold domain-containing protein [Armatimonadota bacterium]